MIECRESKTIRTPLTLRTHIQRIANAIPLSVGACTPTDSQVSPTACRDGGLTYLDKICKIRDFLRKSLFK